MLSDVMRGVRTARAQSLIELGRFAEALEVLAAPSPDDDEADVLCLRAQALQGKGDHGAALRAAEAACEVAPSWEWPHRLLAISLSQLGRHRAALAAAVECVRLAPDAQDPHYALAMIQSDLGDYDAAMRSAATCVELGPDVPVGHEAVARVALEAGRYDLVEAASRRALALDPHDDRLRSLLASALEAQSRHDEATQLRVKALESNPRDSSHRWELATASIPAGVAGAGLAILAPLTVTQVLPKLLGSTAGHAVSALVVAVALSHVLLLVVWAVHARGRRRAGELIPPGTYAALRLDRRVHDLGWVATAGVLTAVCAVLALALVRGSATAGTIGTLVGLAVVELGASILGRRWLRRRHGIVRQSWVGWYLRRTASRFAHRVSYRPLTRPTGPPVNWCSRSGSSQR
ncbi:tetratricopeptide repeat protein [Pseudonocardia xinjiangensis]|uniref:Tetratricopeptide repeat protein n=1 Tax=Pseudonocardia xinjiangensis TaxID=75289 RepID=A0ABX1RB76_9PSEU|nr:tetratricopeptide repeat protein [Pseudonocardia xinjiangensis]NMH77139.1 tetratricopeptide repeat protein [Pseudonocardia xinjiangensis]